MKAKELFKKKAEIITVLDELRIEYPTIKSGASAGKPTQNFKELCELYDAFGEEDNSIDPIVNMPTVALNRKAFGFR